MQRLADFLKRERQGETPIYPPSRLVFNAFCQTPFSQVKAVIVGQDPYHQPGQAEGLSFSVPVGVAPPPSLRNIFKELREEGYQTSASGTLLPWAKEGVLLLNTLLTVREGSPKSHAGKGWEGFTDMALRLLIKGREGEPLVFLLWGKAAQEKIESLLAVGKNLDTVALLKAPHPSPLARGFLGCRHFSKANDHLIAHGVEPIDWNLSF